MKEKRLYKNTVETLSKGLSDLCHQTFFSNKQSAREWDRTVKKIWYIRGVSGRMKRKPIMDGVKGFRFIRAREIMKLQKDKGEQMQKVYRIPEGEKKEWSRQGFSCVRKLDFVLMEQIKQMYEKTNAQCDN